MELSSEARAGEHFREVEEWNRTGTAYPRESCVHELFEAWAERTPDAEALVFEGESLSYARLNARANRLARLLLERGGRGARVALMMPRCAELVVAELAVLKAGAAYVPIDPGSPAERIAFMLEDCAARVVVARRGDVFWTPPSVERIDVDMLDGDGAENPRVAVSSEFVAYVMYTSGSTGTPKGVMVPHRGIMRLVLNNGCAEFEAGDRVAFAGNPGFDASTLEVWAPLLHGGCVVVISDEALLEPSRFRSVLERERVSVLLLTTGLFNQYVEVLSDALAQLRYLLVGGDALDPGVMARVLERWAPRHLLNAYGPTEITTFALTHEITRVAADARGIPVGRPIGNTQAYIVTDGLELAPVGDIGEILIGGDGVAHGYLGRAALTAERFIPDPFGEPGGRLYRTGDLGWWRPDGAIEFAGRGDFQVKIRGYRIEPGEIEAALRSLAGVRDAVVVARGDAPGEKRLVAYVVGDEAPGADVLRAHLGASLPAYMVPAAYVWLAALPLTPNGKVDRKALPAPEGDAFARSAYEAPVGEVEEALAGIWAELLGVERVGRGDHFFDLGGHSLLAVRAISRARVALGMEAASGDLFKRPVLADFAGGLTTAARVETPAIERVDRAGRVPLSFAQQRLWFLEQLGKLGGTYHIPMRLGLRGELDRRALERALDRIVARHEALRTTFPAVGGEPFQRIASIEASALRLVEHDLRAAADPEDALRGLVAEEASTPFDLENGPLVRGRLVRLGGDEHVLLLTMHHIISDGWSMAVFVGELGTLYDAFARGDSDPLAPLAVQYADYAAWQRRWVDGEVLEAQAEYWTRTLAGAPELMEMPTDHARPSRQDFAGGAVPLELDAELTAGLKALSRRQGTTLYMTLLAGWATVLARLSGQADVVIGTPSANRGRGEVEELIGFFVNTLPVRVELGDGPTVAELLARVRTRALEAQENQDIPFEQVVERVRPTRSLAYSPLVQVLFAWQNALDWKLELKGLSVAVADETAAETAKFDLTLTLREVDGRIVGALSYATSLFAPATAERHVEYLRHVLAGMAADASGRVDAIPMLPAAERVQVLQAWNRAEAVPAAEQCIHELFEAQAARTPEATALVFGDERWSYAELDARAERLSRRLAARGVTRGVRVGVCLEWRPELVVAILGVLKAGGAYVPLDPALPAGRLSYLVEDAEVRVLLTRAGLAERVPTGAALRMDVDETGADLDTGVPSRAGPSDLAYVIYTSGSTGEPKGVAVEHGPAAAHLAAVARVHGITPEDRVLQFASSGFDVSLEQVFFPLIRGATLVLRGAELWSVAEFRARVRALGITVANLPPAYWQAVAEGAGADALEGVRLLLIGGDALPRGAARRCGAGALVNCYGPTETIITATTFPVEEEWGEGAVVPIGRPLPGRAVYVLDGRGGPVPVGVAGELCIGGRLLARGYLGRPALTAEKFVPDPFGGEPGARLYRTGDRVRWRSDGALEFLGRVDHQIKVRGFRIEPGEIEARLLEHGAVREAVVVAREDEPGDTRLVAYVVTDEAIEIESLRAHLGVTLPEYMVPAAYVRLAGLPLTPNGKVDRKALPAPEGDAFARGAYEAPASGAEQTVAEIWAELLGVERVGRGDHFFELGGHSLLAVRVVSRARAALGVEVAPGDLFERPVLADFARGLTTAARVEAVAIERVDHASQIPLSFGQLRLWFLEQLGNLGGTYHIPMGLRIFGELDRSALERALDRIVARHEVLRTTFFTTDGEPAQRIVPAERSAFRLVEHDVAHAPNVEDALRGITSDEASAPFDLEHGPLIRGRLVHLAAGEHVLLLTMHHIVSDGWSIEVLIRELGTLYNAFRVGGADPLPTLPTQYADYAAWQRRWLRGEVLERQASYWARTLAGIPEVLELPADHARPRKQDFAGGSVPLELDAELTAALAALSRRHGTTLFMTLLAGWATVLARLSGQADVVIGTPSANRDRREVEDLIGFFVNTLPVRVEFGDGPTVAELLARVRTRALEAQENQDIPFEQVVEQVRPTRSLAYSPLFQVLFAWQNSLDWKLDLSELTVVVEDEPAAETAKFDLTLALREVDGRIVGALSYATSLFEPATAERHVEYLRHVLAGMAADASGRVDAIPMLPAEGRFQVLEAWNRTEADYPSASCIHELFEAQAARTPHATALVCGDERLSYAELNARANQLAHSLRAVGVGPDARVGICVERSPAMVVAILGVLKAGGAYVPLDPAYPEDRLRYMLADSEPAVLLSGRGLAGHFAGFELPTIELDAAAPAWAANPTTAPVVEGLTSEHLAYMIYTSGSTGRPKGVAIAHRNAVNLLAWAAAAFTDAELERVLFSTSLNFDLAVFELFAPLTRGAAVYMVEDALALARTGAEVTLVNTVPSAMRALLDEGGLPASVRVVNLAGEPLRAALVERIFAETGVERVWNLYGPSETTTYSTGVAMTRADGFAPHIGTPLANTRVYVLDGWGAPVPAGVAGELCIGGAGVARGYLGRPELTAERFVADAFGGEPGARLYRTGDRVRWRSDGALEFLGRIDHQVKVRGFRIEPGEIEARLLEHGGVREAVVLAREDEPGDTRLVAYVVGDEAAGAEVLRAHLGATLPEYMVPAAYVRLDALPLTPNGKLDRKALPAPEGDAFARRAYEAPVGETEEALAEIWAELLGVERVGRHDHFFDLGGHSLLAGRVASRASERFQIHVSVTAVFWHTHLSDLARAVDESRASHSGSAANDGALVDADGKNDLIHPDSVDMLSDDDVDALLADLLSKQDDL